MSRMTMRFGAALTALTLAASAGQAGPFTAGNLVVLQIGDGNAPLSTAATAVFLVEINPTTGAIVQTIPMPTTASGSNRALCVRGTSTSVGHLNRSVDGRYLTLAGTDLAVGMPAIQMTQSSTNPRVIGRVSAAGVVDTSTGLTDAFNADDSRSAITTNGTDMWMTGTSAATAATAGVRYATFGSSTSTQLSSTPTNTRVVGIFNNQLYISTMSLTFRGINAVGTGVPTASGQTTTLLAGFDPLSTSLVSPYAFFFSDANTLYVADDRAAPSGGVQKWTFNTGTSAWELAYTLNTGIAAGCRGLTGSVNGSTVTLFATEANGAAIANSVVTIVDSGAGSAFTVIGSPAPANTSYRGIAFAPVDGTPAGCYANCDASTIVPCLNVNDFTCFLNRYGAGSSYANCDASTISPILNVNDFTCFLNRYGAGCASPCAAP